MSVHNDNEVGIKTVAVGFAPLVGLPFNLLPLCATGWQRKDENGDSSCCYPASNVALCFFPFCTAWCYPIDQKKSSATTNVTSKNGSLIF